MINIMGTMDAYKSSVLIVLATILLLMWKRCSISMDPREPPLKSPKIPFVGHLIGMMWHQTNYFQVLSDKYHLPAFTIPLATSKMYILTSPPLIQAAMRSKALSFDPLAVLFTERLLGYTPEAMQIISSSKEDENGMTFMNNMHNAMHESLIVGPVLHSMNRQALKIIAANFIEIGPEFETKPLFLWLRNTLTNATTTAIFGAKNPLTCHPILVEKFWDFETNFLDLMTRPLNYLTARKAFLGREAVQAALCDYFNAGYDQNDDTSALIKNRAAVNRKWGLRPEFVGKSEIGMIFVSTTNAIPTLFWLFCYIFSDAQLVKDLQAEVALIAERQASGDVTIDITKFSKSCPLLNSVYQEVMRLTNIQSGTRFVLEDTLLEQSGKSILLKKDTIVQMPAGIVHIETQNWGADAREFDPRRFMKADKKDGEGIKCQTEQQKLQKKSFYPFGGGKHLCPGRHFAYAEILGMITILLLGYDITAEDGGLIKVPSKTDAKFGGGVKKPIGPEADMKVRIRRRKGCEGLSWNFAVEKGTD